MTCSSSFATISTLQNEFYFRENIRRKRRRFILSGEVFEVFARKAIAAIINFITVHCERILLVRLDNPIPGSLRNMLNVILGGVSLVIHSWFWSKCVHGAVLTLAIFSGDGASVWRGGCSDNCSASLDASRNYFCQSFNIVFKGKR